MNVNDVLFAFACRTLASVVRRNAGVVRGVAVDASIAHLAFQAGVELAARDPQRAAAYRLRLRDVGGDRGLDDLVAVFAEAVE